MLGAPCNGLGLCCLSSPCPLRSLVSRRCTGPCAALYWEGAPQRYMCGLIAFLAEVTGWKARWLLHMVRRGPQRQNAAETGSDADLEAVPAAENAM